MRYTGIGSRKTPHDVQLLMGSIAAKMARQGAELYSGGSEGADKAFEAGHDIAVNQGAPGTKKIFLPWEGFNGNPSTLFDPPAGARMLASLLHPAWERLRAAGRSLHSRNVQQVLGENLDAPTQMLICWTPDAAILASDVTELTGGSGQAIRMAYYYNQCKRPDHPPIEVYNLARPFTFNYWDNWARTVELPCV